MSPYSWPDLARVLSAPGPLETLFSSQDPLGWGEWEGEDGVPSASYVYMGTEKGLNFSRTRDTTRGRDAGSDLSRKLPITLEADRKACREEEPVLRAVCSPPRLPSPRAGLHSAPLPFRSDSEGTVSRGISAAQPAS